MRILQFVAAAVAAVLPLQGAEPVTVRFAPLPTKQMTRNVEEFLPLTSYLEAHLPVRFSFVTESDYGAILRGFRENAIDMAYLGPLPLARLRKEYPDAMPVITFKESDGTGSYRCILAKFAGDRIDPAGPLKVALTQPLSTCGYFMSSALLQQHFGVALESQQYDYTMSHTNALLGVLQGRFDLAGAKDSIAEKFASLGMEIVARSEPLPGFALVVNTRTLSAEQIRNLQQALAAVPEHDYRFWRGIGRYGMLPTDAQAYRIFEREMTIPAKGNMP